MYIWRVFKNSLKACYKNTTHGFQNYFHHKQTCVQFCFFLELSEINICHQIISQNWARGLLRKYLGIHVFVHAQHVNVCDLNSTYVINFSINFW